MSLLRWKKSSSWLLLAAMVLPILAACGGPAATPGSSTASAPAAASTAPSAPASTAAESPAASTAASTAADASAAAAPTAGGKVIRIHQPSYPDVFDPQKSSFSAEIAVLQLNYEGLTKLDSELKAVPAAAEEWTFNETGDVITFTLRDDLTYSDGSPLTADRFRFAALRTCNPETAGQYPSLLYDVEGCQAWFEETLITDTAAMEEARTLVEESVQAPDEKTLVFKLRQAAPFFPLIASTWVLYPAKEESIAKGEDWWKTAENHVGNGPYQMRSVDEEQLIVFDANTNYWEGKPKLDGIEFVYQKSTDVALQAYRAGDLDIVQFSQSPSSIPAVKEDAVLGKELVSYAGANTFAMGFNLTKEPFQDKKVREAFAYTFDSQTYCEVLRSGDCVPDNTWVPQDIPGSITSDKYKFDPEKAKQALAESSYGGAEGLPPIKLTFASSDPANQPLAEYYAQQIQQILGIQMELDPVETRALSALRKSPETYPQACFTCMNWYQDYPDAQNWLSIFWTSTGFAERVAYKNEEFDKLTKQADATLDPAERTKLYEQASQILHDDIPAPVMYHRANVYLVKPEVTGYKPTSADAEYPGERGSLMSLDVNR